MRSPGIDTGSQEVYVGPYTLLETIGKGSTGKVKLAVHKQTGRKVAVKIIRKALLQDNIDAKQRVEREIKILRMVKHPYIMQLHDVMQTSTHLFVVLEYLEGGEFLNYVISNSMTLAECFKLFYQLIQAVSYLHKQNICHRDLKLENFLMDSEGNIKLADFGLACAMPRDKLLEVSCGPPHYSCPEIVKGEKYVGTEADMWSCGVLLYAISTNTLPFDDPTMDALMEKVKIGRYKIPSSLPATLRDLISKMIRVNGADRITMDELMQHPFWVENLPLLPTHIDAYQDI
eukprot:Sspe_Gene.40829::Locus_19724_Transcript_1_1_Confidence_1.000_Length_4075::g.40829::m.40829/K08796/BRSK; BR serine/threonine kinase